MKKVIVCICALLLLVACGQKQESIETPTWQEQYDLGIRYLSEGNYQEAILAFEAAIEIEPKRPEAYAKAAEAYEAMGDTAAAQAIREKGYAETGNESLRQSDPSENTTQETESSSLETERRDYEDGSYSLAEYDAAGYVVKVSYYDADGNLERYAVNEYSQQGEIRITEQSSYQADGSLQGYWILEQDSAGNNIRQSDYRPDGTLESVVEYNDDGEVNKRSIYSRDNTLRFYYIYEYDADGNRARETQYDAEGNIISAP